MGLYDKVIVLLKEADIEVFELGGVDPNPRVTSVGEGAKLCRENNIEVILAVGGGSTIDCAKAIGAAYYYEGDPWDIVANTSKITKVLPVIMF